MIAFERKKFLRTLKDVETKFSRRLKEVNMLAKAKGRQGMDLIIKQCNILFRDEWAQIVG